MGLSTRLGDGRRDNNFKDCPKCCQNSLNVWGPTMRVPLEGRTDIIRCWCCNYEEPRFVGLDRAAEEDLKAKPHKGSRRGRSCSCLTHGSPLSTKVLWDFECPIHGHDGIDW